ncbi:MAG TPA: protein kinase [Thermoanaerobaculia bacterium]|nr:protein kinase [Thermoanaerobaculia bacterium]
MTGHAITGGEERELERALDLFEELADLDPGHQSERLGAIRREAPGLAARIEAMLRADRAPRLDPGLLHGESDSDLSAGSVIGSFRILEELGRGGMGIVYLAERADADFEQRVALKVMSSRLRSPELVGRFQQERRLLARLEHPNIARLIDGGFTPGGLPYYVMELVEGERIDRYCDRHRLTVDQRIDLFLKVCEAVGHAHRHLIVHRDLKPSNILVNEAGAPKLLDFGIAKPVDLAETELTAAQPPDGWGAGSTACADLTRTGMMRLTPEYASPEQLRGEASTTATDVYSMGVLLYELLCGARPRRVGARSPRELAEAITDEAAMAPSSAVSAADERGAEGAARAAERASLRGATCSRLRRRLRGDLDAIVLCALHLDPGKRYETAQALAADLERERAGLSVSARPDTLSYRTLRLLRQHRGLLGAVAVVVLALSIGLLLALRETLRARAERDLARGVSSLLQGVLEAPDPSVAGSRGRETRLEDLLRGASSNLDAAMGEWRPEVEAEIRTTLGRTYLNLGMLAEGERELHRAVALWERVAGFERYDEAYRAALLLIIVPTLQRGLTPELEASLLALLERCRASEACPPDTEANLLAALGNQYSNVGRRDEAEERLEQALARIPHLPPSEERDYLHPLLLRELGLLACDRGELARCRELLEEALTLPDVPDPHRVTILRALGTVDRLLGDLASARELLDRALQLGLEVQGPDHVSVGRVHVEQAETLFDEGEAEQAREVLDRGIETLRAQLEPSHGFLTAGLLAEARLLIAEGRPDRAEAVLREVLAAREPERARAISDPDVARSESLLGWALWRKGEHEEGRRRMEIATEALAEILGDDDPRVTEARARLSSVSSEPGGTRAPGAR